LTPEGKDVLTSLIDGWKTEQLYVLGAAVSLSFLLGLKTGRIISSFRRITNLQELGTSQIGNKTSFRLRGTVIKVSDGDTFRFYHVPTILHSSFPPKGSKLSDVTLPIRVCTIDTPETSKFGKPGQPFGTDAKEYLSKMILNQTVRLHLLQRDQYGRAVGRVQLMGKILPFNNKFVDEAMLKAGLAEVYLGSGAVYGYRGKEYYLNLQQKAKSSKKGMWKLGKKRESAAEYKARVKKQ